MPVGTAAAIALAVAPAAIAAGGAIATAVGQGNANNAKANAQQEQLAQAQRDRDAAQKAAEPSAAELSQIDKTISQSDTAIARQEKLISAIDPTIIEASNQALKLLKGEDAGALNPIRSERATQRTQLESRLRQQLGTGFATSSSGSEALNRFDQQTAETLSGAQQGALSSLLGVSANERNAAEGAAATARGQEFGAINAYSNISARRVNAITGTPITPFAGAKYAGDIAAGENLASIGGGLSKIGSAALGAASALGGGGLGGLAGGGGGGAGVPSGPSLDYGQNQGGGNIFGVGNGT